MNLGLAIKVRRTQLRMKQTQLAEKCDISISYISLIENNQRDPGYKMLHKIARHLDIALSELFAQAESYKEDK